MVTLVTTIRVENQHRIVIMNRVHFRFCSPRASTGVGTQWLLLLLAVSLVGGRAAEQVPKVPSLGSRVTKQVLMARAGDQRCLTDVNHRDPCASVKIGGILFTVAWDEQTKAITYLFSDDHRLVTDSELGIGGGCRLVDESGKPYSVIQYNGWLVTPQWSDTMRHLSDDALWYAELRRDIPQSEYGTVVAFVQSRYMRLPQ